MTLSEAREAFVRGMQRLESNEFARAESEFLLAAHGRETPGLLYYIAYCQEMQSRFTEALSSYRRAQELLIDAPAADVQRLVPAAIERVRSMTASVHLAGLLESDQVFVDGRPVDAREGLALDPGEHEVLISRGEAGRLVIPLRLTAGQERQVTVPAPERAAESEQAPVSDPRVDPADDEPAPEKRAWVKPVVVGTGGGLAAVGAGVFVVSLVRGQAAARESKDLQAELGGDSACVEPSDAQAVNCAALQRTLDRRRRATTAMVIGAAGAGVFGLAAVVFAVAYEPKGALRVSSWSSHRGGGLALSGAF